MNNKEFKPYVPAEKVTPEMTVTSVIMGMILAVVFGAANAYLGLRVGMTVSASIPAAVISMGVIRVIMKKNSILESNLVQTIGSAGESLAAGAIFTMPALFLLSLIHISSLQYCQKKQKGVYLRGKIRYKASSSRYCHRFYCLWYHILCHERHSGRTF